MRNDVLSSEVRHYSAKVGGLGRRGWNTSGFPRAHNITTLLTYVVAPPVSVITGQ